MSENASETVNPMDATTQVPIGSTDDSHGEVPEWLRGANSRPIAELFANALTFAHEHHPKSWAVTRPGRGGKVALDVQGTHFIEVAGEFVRVVVPRDQEDFYLLDRLSDYQHKELRSPVDSMAVTLSRTEKSDVFERLLPEINRVMEPLAQMTRKGTARAPEHQQRFVEDLANFIDADLPSPSYLAANHQTGSFSRASDQINDQSGLTTAHSSGVGGEPSVSSVLPHGFASAGLTYTDLQIASFYTALQTKGFVILSGISGTGKSKIAQRFADLLPDISVKVTTPKSSNTFQVKYQQYMRDHGQIRLLNAVSSLLPVPNDGEAYNLPMSIDGQKGTCRFWTRPPKYGGTYIHPHGALKAALKDLGESEFWLHFVTDEDEARVERIILTSDATAQVLDVEQSLEWRSNHLFLPVRPDWRDGKVLIGYHNPLTGAYVRTGFLDFVIAAGDDYRAGNRNAFFVILDEMNLAHVEYYFADVLSVIESGRDPDGWTVEGIPLAVGEEDADLPARLHLPPNLYIVGTVNMDETTHPFSPKVLDRAFTIELTDVDFRDYPPDPVEGDSDLPDDERRALLDAFTGGGERYPRIIKSDIRETVEDHEQFRADLDNLNTSLKRHRMHFGYRVFDEIMQFVHNAERNGLFSPEDAFDHAVLMKVLPKFNGSRAKLERPLVELILWSRHQVPATEGDAREIVADLENYLKAGKALDSLVVDSDDWRYPATGRRAALMMQDLYTDGFAAFG